MMARGVCYVLFGKSHRKAFSVSLWTLRKYFGGSVCVFVDEEWGSLLAAPGVTQETVRRLDVVGPAHFAKTQVLSRSPFDSTVYLDCDTMLAGPIDDLFPSEQDNRIYVTRVGSHTAATSRKFQAHLQFFFDHGWANPENKRRIVEADLPWVNTGVFSFSRSCSARTVWEKAALSCDHATMRDEMALQMILPSVPYSVLSDRWNYLPHMGSSPIEDVVIWHGTGSYWGQASGQWCRNLCEMYDANWLGCQEWMADPVVMRIPV